MRGGLAEGFLLDLDVLDLGEAADLLVDEVQDRLTAALQLLDELVLALEVPVDDVVLELDQRDQAAVALDHQALADALHAVDHVLDLLRVDVFAGGAHDHVAEASADGVAALFVDAGEVAGVEPAVLREDGLRALIVLVVAHHHVRALDRDLAQAGLRIDVLQTDLHAVYAGPRRADVGLERAGAADERRSLREAIADAVGEERAVQEGLHLRVELGAADAEEVQAAAEGLAQLDAHQQAEQPGRVFLQVGEELAAADGRDDAVLVHLLDDERHGQDGGRADLRERLDQDGRGGDALQVADARADGIGIQQAERHLVGVRHREDGQEDGTLVLVLRVPGVEHRRAEVAVAQHHALGRSGGAGRIDQGGHVHRVGRDHAPVAGEGVVVLLDEFEGLDVDDQVEARERGLAIGTATRP